MADKAPSSTSNATSQSPPPREPSATASTSSAVNDENAPSSSVIYTDAVAGFARSAKDKLPVVAVGNSSSGGSRAQFDEPMDPDDPDDPGVDEHELYAIQVIYQIVTIVT